MSHVVTSPVIITDLECLLEALKKFPLLTFIKDATSYKWFGRWVNDYSREDAAYKLGIAPEDYGKCEHKIHMDGVNYEVGICKRTDGKGWSLVWDFYSDGHRISEYIGKGAQHLITEYNRQVLLKHANTEGLSWNQEENSDSITIEMELNA